MGKHAVNASAVSPVAYVASGLTGSVVGSAPLEILFGSNGFNGQVSLWKEHGDRVLCAEEPSSLHHCC